MLKKFLIVINIFLALSVFGQTKDETIEQLITQLEETNTVLEEVVDLNQELKTENEELEAENKEYEDIINNDDTSSLITELKQEIKEKEEEIDAKDEQIEILLERLEDSNEIIVELRDQVEEDQEEIEGLRDTITNLMGKIDTTTFGIGALYNYPHGGTVLAEFQIPNIPISLLFDGGFLIEEKIFFTGAGVKLEF